MAICTWHHDIELSEWAHHFVLFHFVRLYRICAKINSNVYLGTDYSSILRNLIFRRPAEQRLTLWRWLKWNIDRSLLRLHRMHFNDALLNIEQIMFTIVFAANFAFINVWLDGVHEFLKQKKTIINIVQPHSLALGTIPVQKCCLRLESKRWWQRWECRWVKWPHNTSPMHVPTSDIHIHRCRRSVACSWSNWISTATAKEQLTKFNREPELGWSSIDLQTITTVQRRSNMNESITMALVQSFVWYFSTNDECRRTKRWRWFEKMPRTWSIPTQHNDRSIESNKCRLELNSANRRGMKCRRRLVPAARDTPISFWSNWGNRLEWMWRPLRRWQTSFVSKWNK